jgi:Autotransporter beta-domain
MKFHIKNSAIAVSMALSTGFLINNVYAATYTDNNTLTVANEFVQYTIDTSSPAFVQIGVQTTGFQPSLILTEWSATAQTNNVIAKDNGTSTTASISHDLTSTVPNTYNALISQVGNEVPLNSSIGGGQATSTYSAGASDIAAGENAYVFTVDSTNTSVLVTLSGRADALALIATDTHALEQNDATNSINDTVTTGQVKTVVSAIKNRIKSSISSSLSQVSQSKASTSGLNAGDSMGGTALWFNPSYTKIDDTTAVNAGSHFDGKTKSLLVGADFNLSEKMVAGALIGYENAETDSNNGGDTDANGFIISAYGGMNLDAGFTAYADVGYSNMDTDIKDRTILSNFTTGAGLFSTGSYDTETFFIGAGIMRSSTVFTDMILTGDVGYHYGNSESDSYIDNFNNSIDPGNSTMSLVNFDMELAQPTGWGEYFATAGAELDLAASENANIQEGTFGVNLGAGLRFSPSDNLNGEVGITKQFIKQGHRDYTISAMLRYSF